MSKPDKKHAEAQNAITIRKQKNESEGQAVARHILAPESQAADSVRHLSHGTYKDVRFDDLVSRLEALTEEASNGDKSNMQAILAAQAQTLDQLFNSLLQRSARNMGTYTESAISYMKLALRSQAQCRATLESLVEINHPKTSIHQTNIAHGHQQVNNHPGQEKPPNELMKEEDG